jgi:beta-N-acetylhexosaminidase
VGPTLPAWLADRLRNGLGGVCLFGTNVVSYGQLRALTESIIACNPDAVIAIDEEGGDVTRLFYDAGSPYPGNAVLGRIDRPDLTESVGRDVGHALRDSGCTLDFAPDVDINSNSDNPVIGVRSFGADAELVATHTAAWIRGLQSTGIAASAKHFPGHGDTATDSHLALPTVDRSLEELRVRELAPFRAAIAAGSKSIMTSHILLPQLDPDNPATLSRRILEGLLREELGFTGVIVSDALDMKGASGETGIPEAAVRALAAGCDLLCIGTGNTDEQLAEIEDAILDAVRHGRLAAERLEEAARRVVALARETVAETARAAGAQSVVSDHAAAVAPELVIQAFDVQPSAAVAFGEARDVQLIRIDAAANFAIGEAPWGVWAALATEPDAEWARLLTRNPVSTVSRETDESRETREPHEPRELAEPDSLAIVIGRDNHLHPHARSAIDRLRETRRVVVVDMGWPSDDRAYADVATFGASRLTGEALGLALARWIS